MVILEYTYKTEHNTKVFLIEYTVCLTIDRKSNRVKDRSDIQRNTHIQTYRQIDNTDGHTYRQTYRQTDI